MQLLMIYDVHRKMTIQKIWSQQLNLIIFDGANTDKLWVYNLRRLMKNQQNDCAQSEDSDQPGRPPRVFAVRIKKA